jgi:hypothetical protein
MTPLFTKLNLKPGMAVCALNAPASFEPELAALEGAAITRKPRKPMVFGLAFVTTLAQVEAAARAMHDAAEGDALLWFAYPKQSSKTLRCEFNRDNGWDVLGALGYEPVRMVAVDADWSALRFRKVEHVGAMTRDPSRARTAAGKQRTRAG